MTRPAGLFLRPIWPREKGADDENQSLNKVFKRLFMLWFKRHGARDNPYLTAHFESSVKRLFFSVSVGVRCQVPGRSVPVKGRQVFAEKIILNVPEIV
jgi:hypothetical protein